MSWSCVEENRMADACFACVRLVQVDWDVLMAGKTDCGVECERGETRKQDGNNFNLDS